MRSIDFSEIKPAGIDDQYSYSRYIREHYSAERRQSALFWRKCRLELGPKFTRELWCEIRDRAKRIEKEVLEEGNACQKSLG